MKIFFFFNGSDGNCQINALYREFLGFDQDVLRIYVKGSKYETVGNGFYFPDLEIIASHVRNAFDENKCFDLKKFADAVGKGVCYRSPFTGSPFVPTEIALDGFSRGAVTTLAVAKKLDALNIPLRILANQPVPGEIYPYTPKFSRYFDLSGCKNILSATVLLARHIDSFFSMIIFFRQMVAKFPDTIKPSIFYLPLQSHDYRLNESPARHHTGKRLAEWGYLKHTPHEFTKKIHYWYDSQKNQAIDDEDYESELYYLSDVPENTKVYCDSYIFSEKTAESFHISYDGQKEPIYDWDYKYNDERHKDDYFRNHKDDDSRKHGDYYFTPSRYTQSIFGAETTIGKDPCYIDWLIDKARNIISEITDLPVVLNEDKAAAIVSVSRLSLIDISWINALLHEDENFSKLRQIINKTEEICLFLIDTCDRSGRELMRKHSASYKKEIFNRSYEFFTSSQTPNEKKQFADDIYQAELHFRANALSIEPDILRICLRILTNFITHITGIGLIINIINKCTTGNWLLFSHSYNENLIRDNRMDIVNEVVLKN